MSKKEEEEKEKEKEKEEEEAGRRPERSSWAHCCCISNSGHLRSM